MRQNASFIFGPLIFLLVKYFYANIVRRKTFGKTNICNYNEHEQQQQQQLPFFQSDDIKIILTNKYTSKM